MDCTPLPCYSITYRFKASDSWACTNLGKRRNFPAVCIIPQMPSISLNHLVIVTRYGTAHFILLIPHDNSHLDALYSSSHESLKGDRGCSREHYQSTALLPGEGTSDVSSLAKNLHSSIHTCNKGLSNRKVPGWQRCRWQMRWAESIFFVQLY